MKHLLRYNLFESFRSSDVRLEILKVLSELDNKGNFGYKVRLQYANGPTKRISQKLDIATRIKVEIMKFQDKEKLERWNKSGALSALLKFNYSEIKDTLLKVEDLIKDKYKAIEGINRSGSSSYVYNINSLNDLKKANKPTGSTVWSYASHTDYDDGIEGRKADYYSISFSLKAGHLPNNIKKVGDVNEIENITDVFQDLIDTLGGVKLGIREIGDYVKITLDNLKPDTSSTSFGGNSWVPLTDEQRSELKSAILKYEGMYEMSFFDAQVRYKKVIVENQEPSLREKTIKSQEELFEFMDTENTVAVTIIFKKNV